MQYRNKESKIKKGLSSFLVAWIVVCSGSQHFRIYNSFFTHMLLLVLAVLYFLSEKKITRNNFMRFVGIGFFVGISISIGVFLNHFQFRLNDAMIFFINCFVLMILQSTMTATDFKKKYIYFMVVETALSLLCFTLVTYLNFSTLPGYYEYIIPYNDRPGHNIVYLTPYYTMGWFSTNGFFRRNAGIFWEPGAHAVYLNIAILFIFSGVLDDVKPKSRYIILGILMIGSISTKSTTGYLTLAICFVFLIFREKKKWNTRKNFMIIIAVGIAVLMIAIFGNVFDKLIYRSGSYGTRLNDMLSGLSMVFQDWFTGKGMFVDISYVLEKVGIKNMSNGLVSLMIRIGIPMMIAYVIMLHIGLKKLFQTSGIALYCVDMFFFLIMSSQSLCTYPIFISLLFSWRREELQIKKLQYAFDKERLCCGEEYEYITD